MIEAVADIVSVSCALGAAIGCVYLLGATFAVGARREPEATGSVDMSVTVLKPLCGAEPGLAGRLRSFLRQDYEGATQVICGVTEEADPAAAVARSFGDAIELCVDPAQHGANRKISNLINMAETARHEALVLADSDIEVGPDYLRQVVAALQQPDVGAVSCLYYGTAGGDLWSRLAALRINAQFLPDALTALRLGLTTPCFGATIALRRSTLREIGGFSAFANRLADDYAIGEAIRARGLSVAIPRFAVAHVCFAGSFADLVAQELRAARTIRVVAPWGHAGSVVTHPFPLALIAALFGGAPCLWLAAAALGLRAAICWRVSRAFGSPRPPFGLILLRDLLSFGVFVASFVGDGVRWRGGVYRVNRGGDLVTHI